METLNRCETCYRKIKKYKNTALECFLVILNQTPGEAASMESLANYRIRQTRERLFLNGILDIMTEASGGVFQTFKNLTEACSVVRKNNKLTCLIAMKETGLVFKNGFLFAIANNLHRYPNFCTVSFNNVDNVIEIEMK